MPGPRMHADQVTRKRSAHPGRGRLTGRILSPVRREQGIRTQAL